MRTVNDPARPLYRAQRRQLAKLNAHIAQVTQSDQDFFAQHGPARRHRVRHSHPDEIAQLATVYELNPAPPGYRPFTVVKHVGSGVCLRQFFLSPVGAKTALSEELAAGLWEWLTEVIAAASVAGRS